MIKLCMYVQKAAEVAQQQRHTTVAKENRCYCHTAQWAEFLKIAIWESYIAICSIIYLKV